MLRVKHKFVNLIPDDPEDAEAGATLPSHWNDTHDVTGQGGDPVQPLYVQDNQPNDTGAYLWVQTNAGNPGDITFWINDGIN